MNKWADQWEKPGWVEWGGDATLRLRLPAIEGLCDAEANRPVGIGVSCVVTAGLGRVTLQLSVGPRRAGVAPDTGFDAALTPGRNMLVAGRAARGTSAEAGRRAVEPTRAVRREATMLYTDGSGRANGKAKRRIAQNQPPNLP